MGRVWAAPRAAALALLFLPLAFRLSADDHFRTGGVVTDEPLTLCGGIPSTKADMRFHVGDIQTDLSTFTANGMYISCHCGDLLGPGGVMDIQIPVGLNCDYDTGGGNPTVLWQGASAATFIGAPSRPDNKTVRMAINNNFVAISDHFYLSGIRFLNFTSFTDPTHLNMHLSGVSAGDHPDSAFIRIARPPAAFSSAASQTFSAGSSPQTMSAITLTESGTAGNGCIWSATGIRITIPPNGVAVGNCNMEWNPVQSCVITQLSGTVVPSKILASPVVTFSNGNKTVFIPVVQDFAAGDSIQISGLTFTNFGADSSGGLLTLNVGNSSALTVNHATDPGTRTKNIVGRPSIASASSKVYTVGDATSAAANVTITDSPGTPKINTVGDITLMIPAGLNLEFATSTLACSSSNGAVPAKIAASFVSLAPNPGNKSITIPVTAPFSAGQNVTISGLQFANFTDASAATALQLDVDGVLGTAEATDTQTVAIGKPAISSFAEQVFLVSPPAPATVAMQQITISDDATNPRIFPGTQIRIKVPDGFNMAWQGLTPATTSSNLNTAVTYQTGTFANQILVVTAGGSWTPGGSGTITGLFFAGFAASSPPDNLELWIGPSGVAPTNFDDKLIAVGGLPSMTSTADQAFTVNDPITAAANNTVITDASSPSLQLGRTIQLVIPAGLNLSFDTSGAAPTATPGPGSGTVSTITRASSTLSILITADFAPLQTLTIAGIRYTGFSAASIPAGIQLKVTSGGPVATTDAFKKAIGAPTISSQANQAFGINDGDTLMSPITITDDANTPRIRRATGIRIRIPPNGAAPGNCNMVWKAGGTPTIVWNSPGLSKIATPLPALEDAGKTLVIALNTTTVNLDFAAGDSFTISGLEFTVANPISSATRLELEVNNASGTANALDDKTVRIGTRPTITSVSALDTNGNGSIDQLDVVFSETINGATTSVTAGTGFSIAPYSIAIGFRDAVNLNVVHFVLTETGLPDSGATPTLTYNPGPGVGAGNLVDTNDLLTMKSTVIPGTLDKAAPVIVGFSALDNNANGFLDQLVFTFSENLAAGQEDLNDWIVFDANGTNLLATLAPTAVRIVGNQVFIDLADNTGTLGTPRYRYKDDGAAGALRDTAVPSNQVTLMTNNTPPVAIAGPNLTTTPSKVTLNGTASHDVDGQTITFLWTAPGSITLTGSTTATPSFFTVTPGTYTFQLAVSDGISTSTDSVDITILNVRPTALALFNQVHDVTLGAVLLDAELCTDINGDLVTNPGDPNHPQWTQIPVAGTPTVFISNDNSIFANFTPPQPGVYLFELTMKDSGGNASKSRNTVRVHSGSLPVTPATLAVPTAVAGPNQVTTVGSLVTLDGRLSTDPVPHLLNYNWTQPPIVGPSPLLSAASTANPTFTPPSPGLYTFELIVTDSVTGVSSAPDQVTIMAFNPTNRPPVAMASQLAPLDPVVGTLVQLSSAGSFDPEGATLAYAWSQTGGPQAVLSNPGGAQPTFTPILPGTYAFQLVVYDGLQMSFPVNISFQVKPVLGYLPVSVTTSIVSPAPVGGHVTFDPPTIPITSISLSTTPSGDPSSPFIAYWWEQLGGPGVVLSALFNQPVITFTPSVSGVYKFKVTAIDAGTFMTASATIDVVVDITNRAPDANAGTTPVAATAGQTVTLDGTLSSDDVTPVGSLVGYWTQLTGPPVVLGNATSLQPTFVPPAAGVYVFQLVVSDGTTGSSPQIVEVDVAAAPIIPTVTGGGCGALGLEPILFLAAAMLMLRRPRR